MDLFGLGIPKAKKKRDSVLFGDFKYNPKDKKVGQDVKQRRQS